MTKKIICHDINNKKYEVDSDRLIFVPSIYGVLIEDNKVLLSKQFDGYDWPGGKIDRHETMDEALKREFFEETGINVEVGETIYATSSFFCPNYSKKYEGQFWNCQLVFKLVKKISGELSLANLDGDEQSYVDIPEWIDIKSMNNHKYINPVDNIALIEKALKLK